MAENDKVMYNTIYWKQILFENGYVLVGDISGGVNSRATIRQQNSQHLLCYFMCFVL
jgi:hypothetical protein